MEHSEKDLQSTQAALFGRYRVCALLGEGAMGRVFLAEDPVLYRKVAIKVIALSEHTQPRTRDEYLNRFTLEARACARLNHPSIVAIFDAGEQNGVPWIAFEYVDGDQLEKMLQSQQQLPIEQVVAITLDITAALHHAHESGIIHRDVKPANILIDKKTSIAKLADFGVVKAPELALTQDGSAVGSPGYMSPEQLDGTGTDARSDLFSLGIILYRMLTGKHPFLRNTIPATIFATLHGSWQPVAELRPDAPLYLAKIVAKLLATDRTERFQSAAELLHELRRESRPDQKNIPFDKNAFVGNTTRMHRIAYVLQNIRKKNNTVTPAAAQLRSLAASIVLKANNAFIAAAPLARSVSRLFTPRIKILSLYAIPVLLLFVLLMHLSGVKKSDHIILKELQRSGFSGNFGNIIDSCESLLDKNNTAAVMPAAKKLSETRRFATCGDLLLCRCALIEGRDNDAVILLSELQNQKNWQRIRKKNIDVIIDDCQTRLAGRKMDSTLIASLAFYVFFDHKQYIKDWISRPDYWLRWNSVRMAGRLEVPVDSVELYILDLEHGGSVGTRTHAATRLGESGDKRALEPLKKAANLGLRDPILSYNADLVLKKYFNQQE